MLEDLVKSVKASLYERTASPLFGALAVSWVVWNHRLVVVLLSGMPTEGKFTFIDSQLYPWGWKSFALLAAGPILSAVLFLFVYPYPARFVFRFWRNRQRELKQIRQQIEDETPLTIEESRRIRRQVIDIQGDYERQLSQRSAEVRNLKEIIAKGQEDTSALQAQLEEQTLTANQAREELTQRGSAGDTLVASGMVRDVSDSDLEKALRAVPYRLQFNTNRDRVGSKIMLFGPEGAIVDGRNKNENTWRIHNGRLELVQADGKVHSRFSFQPGSRLFIHTNDPDTLSLRDQYMVPEPSAAKPS